MCSFNLTSLRRLENLLLTHVLASYSLHFLLLFPRDFCFCHSTYGDALESRSDIACQAPCLCLRSATVHCTSSLQGTFGEPIVELSGVVGPGLVLDASRQAHICVFCAGSIRENCRRNYRPAAPTSDQQMTHLDSSKLCRQTVVRPQVVAVAGCVGSAAMERQLSSALPG
jgi:hypothetical protein